MGPGVVRGEVGRREGLDDELAHVLPVGPAAGLRGQPAHDLAHVPGGCRAGRLDALADEPRQLVVRQGGGQVLADDRELGLFLRDEVAGVLAREVKTRRESVEAFRNGGREDLSAKEEAEIAILKEYLPEPLTDEQLDALVGEGIAATGSATPRDLGKVMGWLAPRTRGRADGKVVSAKVAAALADGARSA